MRKKQRVFHVPSKSDQVIESIERIKIEALMLGGRMF